MENPYEQRFDRELKILRANLESSGTNSNLAIDEFIPAIRDICRIFANQGHSGGSAPFYAGALSSTIKKVLLFEPLSPLTGEDWEWGDALAQVSSDRPTFQNLRKSAVFKDGAFGRSYMIDAIVWQGEESHDTFTGTIEGIKSSLFIKSFPFTPKKFYVDVVRHADPEKPDEYTYIIKDRKQLDEVFAYYDRNISGAKF